MRWAIGTSGCRRAWTTSPATGSRSTRSWEFVTLALQRRGRSTHWGVIQLMDGVLPLMIALADELGVEIPAGSLAG